MHLAEASGAVGDRIQSLWKDIPDDDLVIPGMLAYGGRACEGRNSHHLWVEAKGSAMMDQQQPPVQGAVAGKARGGAEREEGERRRRSRGVERED